MYRRPRDEWEQFSAESVHVEHFDYSLVTTFSTVFLKIHLIFILFKQRSAKRAVCWEILCTIIVSVI